LNANVEISYKPEAKGIFNNTEIAALVKLTAAQNSIVPPEKKTPGFAIWNFSASTEVSTGKQALRLNVQLNNVLNTRYYDHTSFYRLIEVPGQGRNLVITMQIPFL
jgi:iron complex outermembrane receptor protein